MGEIDGEGDTKLLWVLPCWYWRTVGVATLTLVFQDMEVLVVPALLLAAVMEMIERYGQFRERRGISMDIAIVRYLSQQPSSPTWVYPLIFSSFFQMCF